MEQENTSVTYLLGYEVSTYDDSVPGLWRREFSCLYSFQVYDVVKQLFQRGYDQDTILVEFRGGEISEDEEASFFA